MSTPRVARDWAMRSPMRFTNLTGVVSSSTEMMVLRTVLDALACVGVLVINRVVGDYPFLERSTSFRSSTSRRSFLCCRARSRRNAMIQTTNSAVNGNTEISSDRLRWFPPIPRNTAIKTTIDRTTGPKDH